VAVVARQAPPSVVDPPPGRAPGVATIADHTGGSGRRNLPVRLVPARQRPRPLPPRLASLPALGPHQVFAFAPWWTLGQSGSFEVAGLSTVAYFGVDVEADGSIVTRGPGWQGLHSAELAALVDRAHAAGDRVVLTAECLDPLTLDRLLSDPSAPSRLARNLARLVAAESLDGVNLDFEGTGSSGRSGLVRLVRELSFRLRAADPHWQLTMDTYGGSAAGPGGFFDIPALAPYVDAFFVMAYDMGSRAEPSPNAPLGGPGWTDAAVVRSYTQVVAPAKVILGIPFYGYEWATSGPDLGSRPLSPATPASYAQLAGRPAYWDREASVPWTTWRQGNTWHQAFFDDPASVYLKTALAYRAGLAGVGVWALGMGGDSPAMMEALLGRASALKGWTAQPSPPRAAPARPGSARPGRPAGVRAARSVAASHSPSAPPGSPWGPAPPRGAGAAGPKSLTPSTSTAGGRRAPARGAGPAHPAPLRPRSGKPSTPPPSTTTTTTGTTTTTTTGTTTTTTTGTTTTTTTTTTGTTTTTTTTTTSTTPTTGPPTGPADPALCQLLGGDRHLAAVMGALADPPRQDAPAEVAAMARALGCGGGRPGPAQPAGLCPLLAAQARVAASLQEAARLDGRPLGVDLARMVERLAAHAGCPPDGQGPRPGAEARSLGSSRSGPAPACGALARFLDASARLGRALGLDLGDLSSLVPAGPCAPPDTTTTTTTTTTTSTTTTSATTTPTTSTTVPGTGSPGPACLGLAGLAGAQHGLQRAAATAFGRPLSQDLGAVVAALARKAGCPPA